VSAAGEARCQEVARVIHAHAFGRLAGRDAASVGRHLTRCASCGSMVEEIRRDTAEVLEATGLDRLPEDLIDLIIVAAAAAAEPPGDGP
jgi:hypothetical protein